MKINNRMEKKMQMILEMNKILEKMTKINMKKKRMMKT